MNKEESKNGRRNASSPIWTVLIILGSAVLLTMYGETMLLPAIPDIINEFGISFSDSSWILTAYLISGAVMTPIAGKLSDLYGRKKIILIIMLIYIIGVAIGAWSENFYVMLISRIVQGIGISMFPIAFGIIRELLPASKLAIGVGVFSSMFAAGSVVGLAFGGTIVQHLGWRTTFFSILPFAIILWFAIRQYVQENEHYIIGIKVASKKTNKNLSHSIDFKGAILLTIMITSFLLTISFIGNVGEVVDSTHNAIDVTRADDGNASYYSVILISIILLIIATISSILFIIVERKAPFPLIDLKLFQNKILLFSNVLILTLGLPMFLVYQTIPFLVRTPPPVGFGGNAIDAAIIQLPFMIIFLIFAPASGFIISKIGKTKPVLLGTIISLIGFLAMFIFHSEEDIVGFNLAIIAVGFALLNTGVFNIILTSSPIQFSGISLGISVVIMIIGMSIGPILAGFFMQSFQTSVVSSTSLDSSLISSEPVDHPSSTAFNLIFFTGIIISVCSIILSIKIRRKVIQQETSA